MPLAVICRDPEKIDDETLQFITHSLPALVAKALSVPGTDGALCPADVEVWTQEKGAYDVNTKDLEIIIWANLYPERQANLA